MRLFELVDGPAAGEYVWIPPELDTFEFQRGRNVWRYKTGFNRKAYFIGRSS